jgi:dUTPase
MLDLNRLDRYNVEKEAQSDFGCYSWRVKTDDGYEFSARVVRDKEDTNRARGVILHPETYNYMSRYTHMASVLRNMLTNNVKTLAFSKSVMYKMKKRKRRSTRYPKSRSRSGRRESARSLESRLRLLTLENIAIRNRINYPRYKTPSASFHIIWTDEYVNLPNDVTGVIHTKSKMARVGISTHPSSGKVDAGFHNRLALEYKNIGRIPIILNIGDPVAELEFHKLDKPAEVGYSERKNSLYKIDVINF